MPALRTLKIILAAVIGIFIGTAAYTSILISRRQDALAQISRYDVSWLASQATTELVRFNQRLSALRDPESGVTLEQVLLRYDILLSRLKLFESGDFQEFVQSDPDYQATIKNFGQVLAALDPVLQQLDREGFPLRALQLTTPLESELSLLAAAANQYGGEQAAEDQRYLVRLHHYFSASVAGLIACGIAFLALLLRNNALLKRAHGELRNLTAHLQNAKDAAEQARAEAEIGSQAKTEFLAAMSHEIRTPLNGIMGFTDILLDREDLPHDMHRQLKLIKTSSETLLTVVNDVLDFSKIEASAVELDIRPFWPETLARNCLEIVSGLATGQGLDLRIEGAASGTVALMGDEARLRQVVLNLLNNAIKFTPAGSVVLRIEREALSAHQDRLRFSVIDTGIGIPKEKQDRLFQRFSQVDGSASRQYGGTGLGLAISKSLVELMQGEIGVVSDPGQGSTFWFSVPLSRVLDTGFEREEAAPAHSGRWSARILVAEDVVINQEIVRAVLEAAGHVVDVVSNGAEAVMAVQRQPYDVVLMDVQMPVMDGVAATKHIRSLPNAIQDIPIIGMTANVYAEQIASFLEAGMNDHVGKPFDRPALYAAIERWGRKPPTAVVQAIAAVA